MIKWTKKDVIKAFNEAMQPVKQKLSLAEQINQLSKTRKTPELPQEVV